MRAVVFAYANVGDRCLRVLRARGVEVSLVVTHRDRAGETRWFERVADTADELGLATLFADDFGEAELLSQVAAAAPDVIFSFYYRDLLPEAVLALAKRGALIPAHKSYVVQLHRYEHWTRQAGLSRLHGLRHAYAQDRFLELAGFPCPAMGGPSRTQMTPEQREADYDARVIISSELGHSREAITAAYLGR